MEVNFPFRRALITAQVIYLSLLWLLYKMHKPLCISAPNLGCRLPMGFATTATNAKALLCRRCAIKIRLNCQAISIFNWIDLHLHLSPFFLLFLRSKVPAYLNVVDIAGLVKGAAEGQGLGNAFLSHISACDGIFHLCREYFWKLAINWIVK